MIYRWVNKFRTHGTVHHLNRKDTNRQSHSGRSKSWRTPHNVAAVRDSVVHSPSKSVCRRSQEFGINRESVRRILIGTWLMERGHQGPPMVPAGWSHPQHLKRNIGMATVAFPWPTDQPQVWPTVVATFTQLEPPRFLYVGIPYGQGVWQQLPDYPWPEDSDHSSNKSDPKGGMQESHRELCPLDPNVPAAPGSSFGAHFLSASETEFL